MILRVRRLGPPRRAPPSAGRVPPRRPARMRSYAPGRRKPRAPRLAAMPKWGLTEEMLDTKPWGFEPELELLKPAKVVTDPVHGDIYLNRLEVVIVNSRPFQRLRRVRQLGMAPEVYPGATNTRFSHSLGTLRAAQDLLDVVLEQRHDPHGVPDL